MKCIIIDDEPLARSIVRDYLQSHPDIEIVAECSDGFEGLKAIQQHQPQLIFVDIQMPKINGFELLELVENLPKAIFTTAFEEYALKAFECNAVDYLLKPFSKDRFEKALKKVIEQTNDTKNTTLLLETAASSSQQISRVVLKDGGKIRIIPIMQIQFIESADDYVKIFTEEGYFLKKKTMSHFSDALPPQQFVRIHRSFIVNVQMITRIEALEKETWIAILSSGQKLAVSKAGYAKLKEILGI